MSGCEWLKEQNRNMLNRDIDYILISPIYRLYIDYISIYPLDLNDHQRKEILIVNKNSSCRLLGKYTENGLENMHTDVRV